MGLPHSSQLIRFFNPLFLFGRVDGPIGYNKGVSMAETRVNKEGGRGGLTRDVNDNTSSSIIQ